MAWAQVTSATASSSGGPPATGAVNTTGADFIAIGISGTANGSPTVTDSFGNTYSLAVTETGAFSSQVWIFYCHNPTVGAGHTFTTNITIATLNVVAFASGLTGTLYVDGTNLATTNSNVTSFQPGAVTPQLTNELFVTELISGVTGSIAINSGFSTPLGHVNVNTVNWGGYFSWLSGTAVAENPTWSWSPSTTASAVIAVFQISAGPTNAQLSQLNVAALDAPPPNAQPFQLSTAVLRSVGSGATQVSAGHLATEALLSYPVQARVGQIAVLTLRSVADTPSCCEEQIIVDPAIVALLANSDLRVAHLVQFDFLTTPKYVWNGNRDLLTTDGRRWSGLKKLGGIAGMQEQGGITSAQLSFTISGIDSAVLALAISEERNEYVNRIVTVWLQFFDANWQRVGLPIARTAGIMEGIKVSQSRDKDGISTRTITLTAENIFYGRGSPPASYYTDRDQQLRSPGDRGLGFVVETQNTVIPEPW